MAKVILYEGEDLSHAIARFQKRVFKDGILNDLRKHDFYKKPSELRREKQAMARKNQRSNNNYTPRDY